MVSSLQTSPVFCFILVADPRPKPSSVFAAFDEAKQQIPLILASSSNAQSVIRAADYFFRLVGYIVSESPEKLSASATPVAAATAKLLIGPFLENPSVCSAHQLESSLNNMLSCVVGVVEAERSRKK
jgi:hypothetical protein